MNKKQAGFAWILTGDPNQHATEAWYEYAVSALLDRFDGISSLGVWGVPKNAAGDPEWLAFDGVHPPAEAQALAS